MSVKKEQTHFKIDTELKQLLKEQAQSLDVTLSEYLRKGLRLIAEDQRQRTEELKKIKALQDSTLRATTEYFKADLENLKECA